MKPAFPLYLASSSNSRKSLLRASCIPFISIKQDATESVDSSLPLESQVSILAVRKMEHAQLPLGSESPLFVLAADTLAADNHGVIYTKPENYEDAKEKIKALRAGSTVSTAYCLDRKCYKDGIWETEKRIVHATSAYCIFNVPDEWLDRYIACTQALHATGGITIEDFGMQFLELVEGSYSTILGLPLFEVRQSLTELGFFISLRS